MSSTLSGHRASLGKSNSEDVTEIDQLMGVLANSPTVPSVYKDLSQYFN
jgi:hypothetical protein